jgi:hypothetical protein
LKNKDQFGNPVASKRDVSEKRFELDPYRIACPQQSQADEACSGSIKLGGVGRGGGDGGDGGGWMYRKREEELR